MKVSIIIPVYNTKEYLSDCLDSLLTQDGTINDDYEIEVFLPDHIIIGSNGGGELYGIDNKGNYFNVPVLIDEDDVAVLGTEIELLPDKINALWE